MNNFGIVTRTTATAGTPITELRAQAGWLDTENLAVVTRLLSRASNIAACRANHHGDGFQAPGETEGGYNGCQREAFRILRDVLDVRPNPKWSKKWMTSN